jgi:tRNA threonylcarbamoyladenosine biosynthesis protein TsaB
MRVLALDTTSRAGSVALLEDDCVLAEHEGDASRPYAERLPADLVNLLALAAVPMTAVDLFAVAAGPGSFTSLRIASPRCRVWPVTHRPSSRSPP